MAGKETKSMGWPTLDLYTTSNGHLPLDQFIKLL